ncbi:MULTISPECIES: hypothetical protein [Burkholderia]|uniref:hypothetical protein n=1 Tax=Burkholderia TaxID=32008 RepID=UPI001581CDA7|nr:MULTISPECIES: hypothetical protein [Burkholderia]MBN3797048.1 hypothetical protein [Burkholderia sp. Ac-20392]
MACVFLARLIDYGCGFKPRDLKSASRGSQFFHRIEKSFFSIPQMIVQYRSDIRQPEKRGGLRKIEIGGNALNVALSRMPAVQRRHGIRASMGRANISYVNQ